MGNRKFVIVFAGGLVVLVMLAVVLVTMIRSDSGASSGQENVAADAAFLDGTTINGVDVSGLDAAGAAEALSDSIESYSFALTMGEETYTATASDLGLAYDEATDLTSLLEAQAADETQLTFTVEGICTADVSGFIAQVEETYEAQLAQALTAEAGEETEVTETTETGEDGAEETEETTTEDLTAPKNAYITYDETAQSYTIVADEPGTEVDWDAVTEQVETAVLALETELELDMDELLEQAEIAADDAALLSALDEVNACLDLELTYTFTPDGGSTSTYTLSRATLATLYYVDDAMDIQVDEEILGNLVSELASTYSASNSTSQFKTTGGSYINITVTQAGQSVDSTGLYSDMLECLQSQTGGTRTAPYEEADDDGDGYWGGNYVEIDLTSQHLWCYKDGVCVVSCDVVSGCVANGTTTPTGCFTIFAKNTDRYLNGSNVDGSTYSSWVSYFMPFSGGCGIHDATWRSSFGGTIYYYSGSHGCVGVSLSNAKTIYNNVSVGTHVVVYGGISASSLPGRTQTVTATAGSTSLTVGDTTTISVSAKTTPTFSSSDTSVVKVDSSGNVTAVGAGSATITISCPSGSGYAAATATVTITVSEAVHVHNWVEHTETVEETEDVVYYSCSVCGYESTSQAYVEQHIADKKAEEAASSDQGGDQSSEQTGAHDGATVKTTTKTEVVGTTERRYYVCSGCGEESDTAY